LFSRIEMSLAGEGRQAEREREREEGEGFGYGERERQKERAREKDVAGSLTELACRDADEDPSNKSLQRIEASLEVDK
jgi:hypothetical protein